MGGSCQGLLSFNVQEWHWQENQFWPYYLSLCFCKMGLHWPICWLKGTAVVKTCRFLLVGLILVLFLLEAYAQIESTSCNKQITFSFNWWCSFMIYVKNCIRTTLYLLQIKLSFCWLYYFHLFKNRLELVPS